MSRGNLFQGEVNKVTSLSYEELKKYATLQMAIIYTQYFETVELMVGTTLVCAEVGFLDKGTPTEEERDFFVDLFDDVLNGNIDSASLFDDHFKNKTAEDIDFVIFKNAALIQDLAMTLLRLILCFAYIDNKFEDSMAERIENIFSNNLIMEFAMNGTEVAPVAREKIVVSELQYELIEYFIEKNNLVPLDNVCKDFQSHSRSELKSALDEMIDMGIFLGGDKVIKCMYSLYSENVDIDDFTCFFIIDFCG